MRLPDLRSSLRRAAVSGPFVGGIVTYVVYRWFYTEARIHAVDIGAAAHDLSTEHGTVSGVLQPVLSWAVTGTFLVLAFLGAVIVLGGIIVGNCRGRSRAGRYGIAGATLFFVVATGWSSAGDNPFTVKAFNPLLTRAFELSGMPGAAILIELFTPMVLAVTVLLMVAASTTLTAGCSVGATVELDLRDRFRHLNTALFVGATMLVAGIVHAGAMHRLPGAFLEQAEADGLNRVVQGLSASMGTIWSLLLLGIYLPSIWLLRTRARDLALESVPDKTPEKVDGWLAGHGLTTQVPQALTQVGALLGPLIVGGPGAPLLQLLTG